MAEELSAYPMDAVVSALRAHPRRCRWRPAPADLMPAIDEALRWRRRVRDDLRAGLAHPRVLPSPAPVTRTAADIAAVEAICTEARAICAEGASPSSPPRRIPPAITLTPTEREAALVATAARHGRLDALRALDA